MAIAEFSVTSIVLSNGTVVDTFPGPVPGELAARAFTELVERGNALAQGGGQHTFYVVGNDQSDGDKFGFLIRGTGINSGKWKACPSLRHAATFDSFEDADLAANQAGLLLYTIVCPA